MKWIAQRFQLKLLNRIVSKTELSVPNSKSRLYIWMRLKQNWTREWNNWAETSKICTNAYKKTIDWKYRFTIVYINEFRIQRHWLPIRESHRGVPLLRPEASVEGVSILQSFLVSLILFFSPLCCELVSKEERSQISENTCIIF